MTVSCASAGRPRSHLKKLILYLFVKGYGTSVCTRVGDGTSEKVDTEQSHANAPFFVAHFSHFFAGDINPSKTLCQKKQDSLEKPFTTNVVL